MRLKAIAFGSVVQVGGTPKNMLSIASPHEHPELAILLEGDFVRIVVPGRQDTMVPVGNVCWFQLQGKDAPSKS